MKGETDLKINEFLTSDIEMFRAECNFSEIELQVFEYKRIPLTDIQIADRLDMSEYNVQAIMRKVRAKIDTVLRRNIRTPEEPQSNSCCRCIISHTMAEWSKIPNFLSSKNTLYVYTDYRTEDNVNIPRIKFGDGINPLSELPFATMSITDKDMEYWDGKPDTENNNFGKVVIIDESYAGENRLVFPTDGYMMLEFDNTNDEFAIAKIYGAKGDIGFEFSKKTDHDAQSKEVFVRKGMRCEYIDASKNAVIKFVPLV